MEDAAGQEGLGEFQDQEQVEVRAQIFRLETGDD